jgi:hypothetical protein
MTTIPEIRETYTRLLDEEERARGKLAKARDELPTVREADVAAFAEAALDGNPLPKRAEITLRHTVENLEVTLDGLNEAHRRLLEDACEAVGEGRRELSDRERMLLRRRVELDIFLTDDERMREAQGRPVKKGDQRPEDLIAFVEDAYGWLDRGFETAQADIRQDDGYKLAVAHIQEAKREHRRQGHMPGTFSMHRYPNIVTVEDLTFLSDNPSDSDPLSRDTGNEIPWPGSLQDPATHRETAAPRS